MTQAELWELIIAYNTGLLSGTTIYFSALTGYLIVAYVIGDKLTAMQTAIITIGFVVFQSLISFGTIGLGTRAVFLIGKTSEEYRSGIMINHPVIFMLSMILLGGIAAALKFMWDIRHRNHAAK
jgi:hypothetical protein